MQLKRVILSAFYIVFPYEVTASLSELWKIIHQIVFTENWALVTYYLSALVKCLNRKALYARHTRGAQ